MAVKRLINIIVFNIVSTFMINKDSEFLTLAEEAVTALQDRLEDASDEVECTRNGNVLSIELDNGQEAVLNIQVPMHELWFASRLGGYHFKKTDSAWIENRTGESLESVVERTIVSLGVDLSL